MKQIRVRAQHISKQKSRGGNLINTQNVAGYLAVAFVLEGIAVKSFLFAGKDPIVIHYIISSGLSVTLFLLMAVSSALNKKLGGFEVVVFFSAVALSVASSTYSGRMENLYASGTFCLSVIACYFLVPRALQNFALDTEIVLTRVCVAIILSSAIMYVVVPGLAYDVVVGRFSGVLISVAVACNILALASALMFFAARKSINSQLKVMYFGLGIVSLFLLSITYTRSSLLEALFCIVVVLLTQRDGRPDLRRIALALIIMLVLSVVVLGIFAFFEVDIEQLLVSFRLLDSNVQDSRTGNWDFALQRIADAPWLGEGMLTKQTQGGLTEVDIKEGIGYSVIYDPHSLALSFAVMAGLPFMVVMLIFVLLPIFSSIRTLGFWQSVSSPLFVYATVHLIVMLPAGGDLTSMGNAVDRIFWIMLGAVALDSANKKALQGRRMDSFPATRDYRVPTVR